MMERLQHKFWDTLERVQLTLKIPDSEMGDLLRLTEKQFQLLRERKAELQVDSVMSLTSALNVGFESLMRGDLDFATLAMQYAGMDDSVPDKYLVGAFSRRRNLQPILDYVEVNMGWRHRSLLLERFQIQESAFTRPDAPINLRLSAEMANYFQQYYGSPMMLYAMGRLQSKAQRDTHFGRGLRGESKITRLYEKAAMELNGPHVEKNYLWEVRVLKQDHAIYAGRFNPELLDALPREAVASEALCHIRCGIISSFSVHAGFGHSQVSKVACVAHGAAECLYEIRFPRWAQRGLRSAMNH